MQIAIAGAGPAGLYAAYLIRRARPDITVRLIEQNPPDATFGFGVVFSDQALSFLREDDPETHDAIVPHMQRWNDIIVNHAGESIRLDGIGFAAIGRLQLLQLLQARAASAGVQPEWNRQLADLDELQEADLIIGADGLNSLVRQSDPRAFGESLDYLENRFVWYGVDREFDALTQTFCHHGGGFFNAHHYRYAPGKSTFIVECDAPTFDRAGFTAMSEAESKARCEAVFADQLQGTPLTGNRSIWRQFPKLWNENWYAGNRVLVGDALHTAHFSIGSGTRLALEDVIALVKALEAHDFSLADALPAYQAARKPVVEKIVRAANASAGWYENFASHMAEDPWRFAHAYIQRSGRITPERLTTIAPEFAAGLAARGLV
ncbi:MAG: FAD-dependent monooxygenase [Rhodospirillales bacterium]